jgi:hypothetical protein
MVEGFLMHASLDAARRPAAAEVTQCLRVGSPPYRFSGRRLAHDRVAPGGDVVLFIDLWQRRKGGYTIAFSRWTGAAWCPDACNAPTLEVAMDVLETICATQDPSRSAPRTALDSPLIDQIAQAALVHDQFNRFQQLAGRALDAWTDLENAS